MQKPSKIRNPLLAPMRDNYIRGTATSALSTTHALLFHCGNRQLRLVTCHSVIEDRGRAPVIAAGRPLSPGDEREILDLLTTRQSANASTLQLYPERLLHADPTRMLWWAPSQVRPMHLRDLEGSKTILTRWPTLVLLARDRRLYLAALPTDVRPSADTELFHAPLPNIYASTELCHGDAVLPKDDGPNAIGGWEEVVFGSAFTHANFDANLAPIRSGKSEGVDTFWRCRDGKEVPFPNKRLVPLDLTLGQWYANPKQGAT